MARYIDADELYKYLDALAKHAEMEGLYNMAHIYQRCLQLIDELPAADVVPRAEVARLQSEINRLKKYDEERDIALHARLISETSEKIFAEIESYLKHLRKYQYCNEPLAYVFHILDESRARHTEGEK